MALYAACGREASSLYSLDSLEGRVSSLMLQGQKRCAARAFVSRLSVMDVTAEGAEGAEDSPTVHIPLLVQSSASSASSAVNFCCS